MEVPGMVMTVRILDMDTGKFRTVLINISDAVKRTIKPYDRVRITFGNRSRTAAVFVSETVIPPGHIGIPKTLADELKVHEGDKVGVKIITQPISVKYILKKLGGAKLSPEEIRAIIKDVVDGNIGDVEMAAFLLSEYFSGMSSDELESLIRAMVDTGSKIEFEEPVYDEHSIGGVPGNSKVALIAVPTVAATGLLIPKTSSRAITSPAGTADTMEVFAKVDFTPTEIKEIASKTKGVLAWGGALDLAPADDIFIHVEHRLMIDPPSQMVASILSKKLAMSVSYLVIDIPVGKGAKVENMSEAEKLASLFLEQTNRLGIKAKCAITYGGQPVGYYIGPALEAKEALETMIKRKGPGSLVEKALGIAGLVFELAGKARRGEGTELAKQIFYSGRTYEKFKEIIEAQGGNPNVKPEELPIGNKSITFDAPTDAYVTHVDNVALTLIARTAGAPFDKGAGVRIHVKAGDKVKKGDPLYTIYAESSVKLSQAYSLSLKLKPITLEGMILKAIPEF